MKLRDINARRRWWFTAAAIVAVGCSTERHGVTLANPGEVDRVIDSFVEAGAYPFLYVRLEDADGDVVYEHGAVNEDLLPGVTVDGQTWLRIWSMSKIVTIAVALDLIEEGVLQFDDAVTDFIPEFEALEVAVSADGAELSAEGDHADSCPLNTVPVESTMTVLDLINHEAGFYYTWTGVPCLDDALATASLPTARDSDDLIRRLAALPLVQQPGAGYYYGTSTTVLGLVAERATGKSLKTLVEERVTGPLGIDGLQYGLPAGVTLLPRFSGQGGVLRLARDGELDIFGGEVPDYRPDHPLYLGGVGMLGTADGYADFLRMLLNRGTLNGHRLLDESTIQDMTSPHTLTDSPYGYNGYNLWVSSGKLGIDAAGPAGLWLGGGYESTHFWIDPERDFVGVIMSQMYWVPESGAHRDDIIRTAIYEQLK